MKYLIIASLFCIATGVTMYRIYKGIVRTHIHQDDNQDLED